MLTLLTRLLLLLWTVLSCTRQYSRQFIVYMYIERVNKQQAQANCCCQRRISVPPSPTTTNLPGELCHGIIKFSHVILFLSHPSPILAVPCQSLLILNFAQIVGFVKVVTFISISCYMDLSKLTKGISINCYMDLSKLIHGFL